MSKNEISTREPKQSVLVAMADKFCVEPAKLLTTLKNTAFKGATDDQMMALCVVAHEYGLNPFTKEIYAFPDKGGGIVPVIGVDGWYSMVNANPQYDGCEFSEHRSEDGNLISTTCTLHRKDREHPTVVTEYVSENRRNTDPWRNQPTRMNRHRAFVQCARIAFGISLADPEDAERTVEYREAPTVTTRGEELTAESNPFDKKPIEAAPSAQSEPVEGEAFNRDSLSDLMKRDGVAEGDLLTVLADEDICEPDISGVADLTPEQMQKTIAEWSTFVTLINGDGKEAA